MCHMFATNWKIWAEMKNALVYRAFGCYWLILEVEMMVGVRGFEPPTPASRTQYSTRLSYTPIQ